MRTACAALFAAIATPCGAQEVDAPPTIPTPVIAGWNNGRAPFCAHVKMANLPPFGPSTTGGGEWFEGTFEWRFKKWLGGDLNANDHVDGLDIAGNVIMMHLDQKGWNAACWLPTDGEYKAEVRYRNRDGLYSPWMASPKITVHPNDRGKIWVSENGSDTNNCGTLPTSPLKTLDKAIRLMYEACPGAANHRREIIVEGTVEMLSEETIYGGDVYIRAKTPADDPPAASMMSGPMSGSFGPGLGPAVVVVKVQAPFKLGLPGDAIDTDAERVVFEGLQFRCEHDNADLFSVMPEAGCMARNTTFINSTFTSADPAYRFHSVWGTSDNSCGLWLGNAIINCDQVGAVEHRYTVFGMPNTWTVWGCDWKGPYYDPDEINHICRLVYGSVPGGTYCGGQQGTTDYVSIQASTFNFGSSESLGAALRSYVARYFAAHNCTFRNGTVTISQSDGVYNNPPVAENYKFTRCKFEFDALIPGTPEQGGYLDVYQVTRRLSFDGCSFVSNSSTHAMINHHPWGGTGTGLNIPTQHVKVTNCTLEMSRDGEVYREEDLVAPGAANPTNITFRNNLFVTPAAGPAPLWSPGSRHFRINAATPTNYDLKRNVYRSGLTWYATIAGGSFAWNGWSTKPFTGDERLYPSSNPVQIGTLTLQPSQEEGATDYIAGNPRYSGDARAYNGMHFYRGAPICYTGAWQSGQAGTNFTQVTIAPGSVTLHWGNIGAAGYWIHFDDQAGGSEFQRTAGATATSITISPLTSQTFYYFRIMAYNADGSLSQESIEVEVPVP